MDYTAVCIGASSHPVVTTTLEAACTSAGGAWAFDSAVGFPELTLSGAADIAAAVAVLWGLAWSFRVIKRQLSED